MYKEDLELFKQAVKDSFSNKLNEELESEASASSMTRKSDKIIKRICYTGGKPSTVIAQYRKRKIIAILAATAIALLTSCATIIYRHEIKSFITRVFDDHIELTSPDDSVKSKISEFYTISTIPGEYKSEQEIESFAEVYRKWSNNKSVIIFEQLPFNSGYYNIDNEDGTTEVFYHKNKEIIKHVNGNEEKYIWNDNIYFFSITMIGEAEIGFSDLYEGIEMKQY